MVKRRFIWTSLLVTASALAGTGLFAKADGLDAGQTADSIFRAAQQQQVQNQQSNNNQQYHPATNSTAVRSGTNDDASDNAGSSTGSSNAGLSDNNSNDDDGITWDDADSGPGLSDNDEGSSNSSSHNDDDDTPKESHHETHHQSHVPSLTPKQKAAQRADQYLAKVRQKIALRTAQNNDGGAWALRHSYENQLQVIKNGSRTAQTRALQVQLSGELNQLQVAHDQRVNTFNQQIDQLPNNHSTDAQAVKLQDSIDYEDAMLAQKQSQARRKILKRIKAINPVHRKKAVRDAKRDYHEQLRDKGLVDPYKLQSQNRKMWQEAQKKAAEIREDYW